MAELQTVEREQIQYQNLSQSEEKELNLIGLTCTNCASKILKAVQMLPQVEKADINFARGIITIWGSEERLLSVSSEVQKIVDRIEPGVVVKEGAGFGSQTEHQVRQDHGHTHAQGGSMNLQALGIGSLLFLLVVSVFELAGGVVAGYHLPFYLELVLYGGSYLLIGGPVLKSAFRNIRHGDVFDENFLMVIATFGAFAIREFPEAVAVMLFYMIGEYFQERAVDRSRRSIAELMDIKADYVNLKKDGQVVQAEPTEVHPGDIIMVRAGEKVPLDGQVILGDAKLDTSTLTGESVLRKVKIGDQVLSGMVNKDGLLTIRVSREYSESTVAKILELVEKASGKKATTEKFITRFARYYTPAVVISAILIAVLPPLLFAGASFQDWFYRSLIFLVISCPCALVISIPLGFFGGIGRASRQGILVKGGNYLEALHLAEIIVYDKTGTLTAGSFSVKEIIPEEGVKEEEVLRLAAFVESHSDHPIAQSIMEAYGEDIFNEELDNFREISGKGIRATVDGLEVLLGNEKLLKEAGIKYTPVEAAGTITYLAFDSSYYGAIIITDEIKADAKQAVRELQQAGISRQIMLTGDRKEVAAKVAAELGFTEYFAELLPDEKVAKVEELLDETSREGKLVFVGDGINDAPVLARADIGVAMGGLGSDAAIEAADVVLMTDEPSKLVTAINTARRTRKIVWQNIAFTLLVKGTVLGMGAFGMANMWEAVFADVGVALLAVLNSVRIIRN